MSAEDGMPTNDLSDIIITPEQPEVKDGRGGMCGPWQKSKRSFRTGPEGRMRGGRGICLRCAARA